MNNDEFVSFSSVLDNSDVGNDIQPLPIAQDQHQASLDVPPSSFDLGNGFEFDAIQSCAVESELHMDVQQSAAQVDTPFSRADVNKALFEARLQSLGDTELKFPWESGVVVAPGRIITLFAIAKKFASVLKGKLNQRQTSWDSGLIFMSVVSFNMETCR